MPNENPVQDAVSAQLKYEINGDELRQPQRTILQQKYGLALMAEDDINFYLEVLGGN